MIAGLLGTALLWLINLRNPGLFDLFANGGRLCFFIVLAPPFVATFSLGRILFPEIQRLPDQGPAFSLIQRENAVRRLKLLIAAGILAVINFVLIVMTASPAR